MKPDKHISKVAKNVFRDGSKAAVAQIQWEHFWLKQQQQKAIAERDYFKGWRTEYYK